MTFCGDITLIEGDLLILDGLLWQMRKRDIRDNDDDVLY